MNSGLRLTVVGCSGSVSGPDSAASSYLVEAPWPDQEPDRTFALLLDCGPGAYGALQRHLDPSALDAIALSHLHPDHCLDLCAYYVGSRFAPSAPWPAVDLYGPPGTLTRLARAYDPSPGGPTAAPELDLTDAFRPHDWLPEQQIGPLSVRTAWTAHPAPCVAVRIEHRGRSLTFSGDTGPTAALVELARDTDLLLCEAAFLDGADNPPDLHLSGRQAGEHAAAAAARRLVLTHVPPWHRPDRVLAEAESAYTGPTALAASGQVWTLD